LSARRAALGAHCLSGNRTGLTLEKKCREPIRNSVPDAFFCPSFLDIHVSFGAEGTFCFFLTEMSRDPTSNFLDLDSLTAMSAEYSSEKETHPLSRLRPFSNEARSAVPRQFHDPLSGIELAK
jgi:hypothetical protein